jgi:hypothetical protein
MTQIVTSAPEYSGVEVHGMSRASFILRGAMAAGAVYGASAVGPFVGSALGVTGATDVDILNFALTLEYLETDLYTVKAKSLKLSSATRAIATEFGDQEMQHVAALRKAIQGAGGMPAKKPTFVFPATDEKSFLQLAYVLENTGVGAYNGAGPAIQNVALLAAAGSIVQVEARHAATIGLLTKQSPVPNGGFDKPLTKQQVLAKAGPLIKS